MYSQPGITRVAFISQVQPTLTDAINTFTAEATAHGVKVVSNQQTSLTTTSFQSQITNVLSANPKAIGVSGIGPADGSIIAGLRSAGFKGIIFAQQAADSAATVQAAGNSVAGVPRRVLLGPRGRRCILGNRSLNQQPLHFGLRSRLSEAPTPGRQRGRSV